MNAYRSIFAVLLVLVAGCGLVQQQVDIVKGSKQAARDKEAKREAQLDVARQTPLKFKVEKAQSADAWGRAQSYVSQHSDMKIQMATEFVIETYNPTVWKELGWKVTKTPMPDGDQIEVRPFANGRTPNELADSGHVAAHFIKTGIYVFDEPIPAPAATATAAPAAATTPSPVP